MPDDTQSFASSRARLDEIVAQVRKKDTSLEKSLDLLEEGVRLANQCTELIDHADWETAGEPEGDTSPDIDAVSGASSDQTESEGDANQEAAFGDDASDDAAVSDEEDA